jgi:Cu(I)/Ag(I) efflux system membrane fusion protein
MKATQIVLVGAIGVGAFLAGRWRSEPPVRAAGRRVLYYHDPMHPAYRSDKPGIAPDCGMKLEPVYAGDDSSGAPSALQISTEKQQLIGVRTTEVRRTSATHVFRLTGRVVPDETRIYRVTGKVEGWVREIYAPTTGSLVKKGEPLVGVFGRDYRMMQQSYVFALNAAERAKEGAGTFDAVEQNRLPVQETLAALHSAGVDETQIEEIAKTRQPQLDTRLMAPVSGFVQARNVFPNQKFEPGSELYRIIDISRVWIVADLYSSEAQYVRPGAPVRISLPAYPQRTFSARVSNVPPEFDSVSRTLKLRLEADNPDFALRPDMLVDIEASAALPSAVTVPADAVMDAGLTHTVYIDRGEGRFEPRMVETGWRYDNQVEIVKGLEAGERVVSAATFLIDSESRLHSTARAASAPLP